ncbi:MAG TPA: sensor histidine kinase [Solirubrobacteraceae bacterium]
MSIHWTSPNQEPQSLRHEALLYESPDQLERAARAFIAAGANAGEPVLAVLPPHTIEELLSALGDLTCDVRFEDMEVVGRNPNCLLELYQEWIEAHDGRVRVLAEGIWPNRSYAEAVECLRHEALVNHELSSCQASILCLHDAANLAPEVLAGAELTHPSLVDGDGVRRASSRYGKPDEVYAGRHWPQEPAMPPVSELAFEGDLHALRESVAADPIVSRLSPERRADLVFAVSEAAATTVKYGDGECTARIWHDGTSVVTEVSSSSVLENAAVGRRRPPPDSLRGRGLWLINQLCDLVELRSGRNGTSMRIHVRDRLAFTQAG